MGLIDFQKKRSVAEKAVQEFNIKDRKYGSTGEKSLWR